MNVFFSECDCDVLGTNSTEQFCNRYTGQCPCLKNVEGVRCDHCIANHWKIASGEGCELCECDPTGSESEQCNPVCKELDFMFNQFLNFELINSMTVNADVKKDLVGDNAISVKQTFGAIRMLNVIVSIFFVLPERFPYR